MKNNLINFAKRSLKRRKWKTSDHFKQNQACVSKAILLARKKNHGFYSTKK